MDNVQTGILALVPWLARYLTFSLKPGSATWQPLQALTDLADGNKVVVGVGYPTDFARFEALSPQQQDASVGRRRSDNEEIADASPRRT